jgi:hypothetical protein
VGGVGGVGVWGCGGVGGVGGVGCVGVWGHSLRSTFPRLHLLRLWTPTILLLLYIIFLEFDVSRGHPIERQNYIDDLLSSIGIDEDSLTEGFDAMAIAKV